MWADAQNDAVRGYLAKKVGDFAEAVKWYRKAADQGFALGQYALGVMYGNGEGVTQDNEFSTNLD
ncbi:hypothetical protein N9F34_03995 [Alphaproteobacteria bacterium]|nr:hypothetical protein [Alphaproteobacteria bacterium]